jgi:hypothetical protein
MGERRDAYEATGYARRGLKALKIGRASVYRVLGQRADKEAAL